MAQEFLMLAHNYKPTKHDVVGYFLSEKLDGQRCFWDGGITRGIPKAKVPWANTAKDARYITPPVATGLWSRYGNVIHAPKEFLDALPPIPLDGELFIRRGKGGRQDLSKIVKTLIPTLGWKDVKLYAFDSPSYRNVFHERYVKNTNFKKYFESIEEWIKERGLEWSQRRLFRDTVPFLEETLEGNKIAVAHKQLQLPMQTSEAHRIIRNELESVAELDGEGLILRKPTSVWWPERSHELLKIKKLHDMEGTVTGYTTGRRTSLGSKLLGMMGALILKLPNGKTLELSGFTEGERTLDSDEAREWATRNPGAVLPQQHAAKHFPRGSSVTFRYRDLTKDNIPTEARYWRKR